MICITFDTDYMRPDDMAKFLDEFAFPGLGTFFLHDTFDGVDWGRHELGPHPIFEKYEIDAAALDKSETYLPSHPKGMRSHSCVTSHMLGIELKRRGYLYCSNQSALYHDNISPMRLPWGIWELPIYYMDNMDFTMFEGWPDMPHAPFSDSVIDMALNGNGLYIFDFHPLHVILNTGNRLAYAKVKDDLLNAQVSPFDLTFKGRGSRVFFEKLVTRMADCKMKSCTCSEVIEAMTLKCRGA